MQGKSSGYREGKRERGGKRSKQSWKNEHELYCAPSIGCKSCLQELLKWRNSYLLTLRSDLQSPNVIVVIYVTQSRQDSADKRDAGGNTVSVLRRVSPPASRLRDEGREGPVGAERGAKVGLEVCLVFRGSEEEEEDAQRCSPVTFAC